MNSSFHFLVILTINLFLVNVPVIYAGGNTPTPQPTASTLTQTASVSLSGAVSGGTASGIPDEYPFRFWGTQGYRNYQLQFDVDAFTRQGAAIQATVRIDFFNDLTPGSFDLVALNDFDAAAMGAAAIHAGVYTQAEDGTEARFDSGLTGNVEYVKDERNVMSAAFDFSVANEAGERVHVTGYANQIAIEDYFYTQRSSDPAPVPGTIRTLVEGTLVSPLDSLVDARLYAQEAFEGRTHYILDFPLELYSVTDPTQPRSVTLRIWMASLQNEGEGEYTTYIPYTLVQASSERYLDDLFIFALLDEAGQDMGFVQFKDERGSLRTQGMNPDGTLDATMRLHLYNDTDYLRFEAAFVGLALAG